MRNEKYLIIVRAETGCPSQILIGGERRCHWLDWWKFVDTEKIDKLLKHYVIQIQVFNFCFIENRSRASCQKDHFGKKISDKTFQLGQVLPQVHSCLCGKVNPLMTSILKKVNFHYLSDTHLDYEHIKKRCVKLQLYIRQMTKNFLSSFGIPATLDCPGSCRMNSKQTAGKKINCILIAKFWI